MLMLSNIDNCTVLLFFDTAAYHLKISKNYYNLLQLIWLLRRFNAIKPIILDHRLKIACLGIIMLVTSRTMTSHVPAKPYPQ